VSRLRIGCLLVVWLLVSACGEQPKQRPYSAFIACTQNAGFRAYDQGLNRRRLPSWLEHVANLKSPHRNHVIVTFVTADEARARARQQARAAITAAGPPRGHDRLESAGRRVWYWTSGPEADEADALVACF
jgi:hypothetical protein